MRQIFAGTKTSGAMIFNRFGNLPFIGILIIIELYFWANGGAWFQDWNSSYGQLIETYIVMTLIFLVLSWRQKQIMEQVNTPLWMAGRSFGMSFIITWGILECCVLLGVLQVSTSFDTNLFWQTVMIQVCVVATAEEIMFRGVILQSLNFYLKSATIAVIGSAFVFAIWHLYAYQIIIYHSSIETVNWFALVMAFFIGIVLAIIALKKEWGLSACIGIHACYNLVVLGVLTVWV